MHLKLNFARSIQGGLGILFWFLASQYINAFHISPLLYMWLPWVEIIVLLNTLGQTPFLLKFLTVDNSKLYGYITLLLMGLMIYAFIPLLKLSAPTDDQSLTTRCAAKSILQGKNPYLQGEPSCYKVLNQTALNVIPTALHEGAFAQYDTHPPLSIVNKVMQEDQLNNISTGFPLFGYPPNSVLPILLVSNTNWQIILYLIIALSFLLAILIAGRWKNDKLPLYLFFLFTLYLFILYYHSNPEIIAYLLLALSFAQIKNYKISSIVFALAITSNQLAWFFVPIYLLLSYREGMVKQRILWISSSFLIAFLPWIIWKPEIIIALWHFIFIPSYPIGVGLGVLLAQNIPHLALLSAMLIYTIAILIIAIKKTQWQTACVLLTINVFWFSYRGEVSYYLVMFLLLPALWVINDSRFGHQDAVTTLDD